MLLEFGGNSMTVGATKTRPAPAGRAGDQASISRDGGLPEVLLLAVLHFPQRGGTADACQRGDLVDRQVADAVMLDLAGDNGEDRHLPERIVMPEAFWQHA